MSSFEPWDLRKATVQKNDPFVTLSRVCAQNANIVSSSSRAGGLPRKCALHLVMAGHRYRAANDDVHAVECYVASRDCYRASYEQDEAAEATDHPRAVAAFRDDFFKSDASLSSKSLSRVSGCGWGRIDEHVEHASGSASVVSHHFAGIIDQAISKHVGCFCFVFLEGGFSG